MSLYYYKLYNLYVPFTVQYADQSVEECRQTFQVSSYSWRDPEIACAVSYDEWEIGIPYTCTVSLLGLEDTFTVTLGEVQSIDVSPVEHIERTDGYWDDRDENWYPVEDSWYRYNIDINDMTVTMTDGMVFSGSRGEIEYQLGSIYLSSDQSYSNQWGIGEHTATVEVGEFCQDYSVIITESPIAKIEIPDMEITEFTHGYYQENGNYIYNNLFYAFMISGIIN